MPAVGAFGTGGPGSCESAGVEGCAVPLSCELAPRAGAAAASRSSSASRFDASAASSVSELMRRPLPPVPLGCQSPPSTLSFDLDVLGEESRLHPTHNTARHDQRSVRRLSIKMRTLGFEQFCRFVAIRIRVVELAWCCRCIVNNRHSDAELQSTAARYSQSVELRYSVTQGVWRARALREQHGRCTQSVLRIVA